MKTVHLLLIALLGLAGCKPQDPAPLPPQVGSRAPSAATAEPAPTGADAAATDVAASDQTGESSSTAPTAANSTAVDGAAVYAQACATCHATGLAGAPKLGDAEDWGPRLAQGEAVLLQHALEGYTGEKGVMPPKGGFMQLSQAQLQAAIKHMSQATDGG